MPDPADSVSADCNGVILEVGDCVETTFFGFVNGQLTVQMIQTVVTADNMGTFLTLWNDNTVGAYVDHPHGRVWLRSHQMRKVPSD